MGFSGFTFTHRLCLQQREGKDSCIMCKYRVFGNNVCSSESRVCIFGIEAYRHYLVIFQKTEIQFYW